MTKKGRETGTYTEEQVAEMLKGVTEFQRAVYLQTFKIPRGMVSTYSRVARAIGNPKACRAVANALHNNPIHPIVPCQRVVRNDGSFGGEPRAADGRRQQVIAEGVAVKDGKVVLSGDVLF